MSNSVPQRIRRLSAQDADFQQHLRTLLAYEEVAHDDVEERVKAIID